MLCEVVWELCLCEPHKTRDAGSAQLRCVHIGDNFLKPQFTPRRRQHGIIYVNGMYDFTQRRAPRVTARGITTLAVRISKGTRNMEPATSNDEDADKNAVVKSDDFDDDDYDDDEVVKWWNGATMAICC